MAGKGGHIRSGKPYDPSSGRSDKRGYSVAVLATSYGGRLPGLNQFIPRPTTRHRQMWEELWRTPQATVWIKERWRWPVVAELVRLQAITERPEGCAVGVYGAIRHRRDDLGLSTAGARAEGWEVAVGVAAGTGSSATAQDDEVGARRLRRSQHTGCDASCPDCEGRWM